MAIYIEARGFRVHRVGSIPTVVYSSIIFQSISYSMILETDRILHKHGYLRTCVEL